MKLIYKQKKTPNSKSNYFFGFKSFSLVQNNQPLIGDTNKLSVKKQTKKKQQTNKHNFYSSLSLFFG